MTSVNDLRTRYDNAAAPKSKTPHEAALQGAMLAFSNPGQSIQYPKPSNLGRPEATAAAHLANQPQPISPAAILTPSSSASFAAAQTTFKTPASESHSVAAESDMHPWYRVGISRTTSNSLLEPRAHSIDRARSPSGIAASLAAARHSPVKLDQPTRPTTRQSARVVSEHDPEPEEHLPPDGAVKSVRRLMERRDSHQNDGASLAAARKVSRIPADISTVRIRPQTLASPNHDSTPLSPKASMFEAQGLAPVIHSPKPVRSGSSAAASIEAASRAGERQMARKANDLQNTDLEAANPRTASRPLSIAEKKPLPTMKPLFLDHHTSSPSDASRSFFQPQKTEPIPLQRPRPPILDATAAARSVYDGPSLHPSGRHHASDKLSPLPSHEASTSTSLSPLHGDLLASGLPLDHPSRRAGPHLNEDSLANAIVGASLASSRVSSPAKDFHPSSIRRKSSPRHPFHYHHHHHHHNKHMHPESRTSSPSKGFRHTMRAEGSSASEEERPFHKKSGKFGFRKTPNKHHEGDRRRWRDEVTERERKRYEGVWAANKGLHVAAGPDEQGAAPEELAAAVGDLVTRDIWRRSRLPDHVLEEIWELVDRQKRRRLSREEFVVGLWLVDQRLKGRKMPSKVGVSIWRSVVGIYGLRMPKMH